jgi:hypothetical protein
VYMHNNQIIQVRPGPNGGARGGTGGGTGPGLRGVLEAEEPTPPTPGGALLLPGGSLYLIPVLY